MKLSAILSIVSSLSMGLGIYLSMRQYFIIKAYKENRKYRNIIKEGMTKMPKLFDSDFIEILPATFILRKLSIINYNELSLELKKMYNLKAKYELLSWISFIACFVFVFIETGGKITGSGY